MHREFTASGTVNFIKCTVDVARSHIPNLDALLRHDLSISSSFLFFTFLLKSSHINGIRLILQLSC